MEFQGRDRQYFQLQFINAEIDNFENARLNINRNENLSLCCYQYKTLKYKANFSEHKLEEMENRQRSFNYQKSHGINQHDKRKKKQVFSYYHKKANLPVSS